MTPIHGQYTREPGGGGGQGKHTSVYPTPLPKMCYTSLPPLSLHPLLHPPHTPSAIQAKKEEAELTLLWEMERRGYSLREGEMNYQTPTGYKHVPGEG